MSIFCWNSRVADEHETKVGGASAGDDQISDDVSSVVSSDSDSELDSAVEKRKTEVKNRLFETWKPLINKNRVGDKYVLQQIDKISYERNTQRITLFIENVEFALEDFEDSPVRFMSQMFEILDSSFGRRCFDTECMELCSLLRTWCITARWVHLDAPAVCSPHLLNKLLRVLHAQHVNTGNFTCEGILRQPYVIQMESIATRGGTDEELLNLNAAFISLMETDVTPEGINTFLKQYARGERELDRFIFDFGKRLHEVKPPVRAVLHGLKVQKLETAKKAVVFDVLKDNGGDYKRVVFLDNKIWIVAKGENQFI